MCYHFDLFKRAKVLVSAVVLALIYGAFNTHICVMGILHSFAFPSRKDSLTIKSETERLKYSIPIASGFIPEYCPTNCEARGKRFRSCFPVLRSRPE